MKAFSKTGKVSRKSATTYFAFRAAYAKCQEISVEQLCQRMGVNFASAKDATQWISGATNVKR
jgi:hypothetical protein